MGKETTYRSFPFVFKSRGLMARPATDRPPDEALFQNMNGCLEREEEAISTRYGSTILNRDPDGTPNGQNFPLPNQPVTLARMLSINGASYRYATDKTGQLWRITGSSQGQYSSILSGLSGRPCTALVNNFQGAAQPFLIVYDSSAIVKDNGTGTPTQNGIFAPTQPVIATQYAPEILIIQAFVTPSGITPTNMTHVTDSLTAITATGGTPILSGDYFQYTDSSKSYNATPDGMLATSNTLADGQFRLKFHTFPVNNTYDIVALNNQYAAGDTFNFNFVQYSIAASTTGYIQATNALDLSNYQDDDLIAIVLKVSNPECVQEIRVEFDVAGSDYSSAYYYKSLIPVSYQGNLSLPQTNDPTSAMVDAVFDSAMGITNWSQQVGDSIGDYPVVQPGLRSTQPSQISSGEGSWSVIYVPKGQFQPVGNAGQSGADWSVVGSWRVQVTTNSQGSTDISFNGLYIQGSPTSNGIGTNAGASSYGGVGYDFRTTYYDATTQTESNGCPENYFSITPTNPGGQSLLIILRQAVDLQLQYSANPSTTHVRVYARGGVFGNNWYQADQVPNITGTGVFHYTYILPDSALSQGDILSLTNDVPVTSTLPSPIATTLIDILTPLPANTNTPTLLTVYVADTTAVFVPNQIVDIGTPQNLEQVYVVTGGTGQFTAYIQLPHGGQDSVTTNGVGTGLNDGTGTWTTPQFITTPDGSFATVQVIGALSMTVSSPGYLLGRNCGFSQPALETIQGIQVDVLGFVSGVRSAPTVGVSTGLNAWTNVAFAYDDNFTTFAHGSDTPGINTATTATWSGFPAAPAGVASIVLNVNLTAANASGTPGSFTTEYSLNNGSTWIVFPGVPTGFGAAQTTYGVNLVPSQDMTKVQVRATVRWSAGSIVQMDMYEIWADIATAGSSGSAQFAVQLQKAGSSVGVVKTINCPLADSYVSLGGPTDLWGTTWTTADVNDPNFGTALQAQINNYAALLQFNVDFIRVTVYGTGAQIGEPINVYSTPGVPLNLAAIAYGQTYMAGDKNNPHYLYYSPVGLPQYCPPQNYIPIGTPTDPITAVINFRGILFVRTYSTWYQVSPGSPPTYQSTGSKHGSPANFDWCLTEKAIWFQGFDGIRTFVGADGEYKSLIIEWLYRDNDLAQVELVDLSQLASVVSAFKNNTATFSYIGQDGLRHRIRWNENYKRWRNDDVQAVCMLTELDTNKLLMAVPYPDQSGWAIISEDITKDYDDGGWASDGSGLVQVPIAMELQLPYIDFNAINQQKQINCLTIDAQLNGSTMDVQLLFDDDNGTVPPIDLGTITGTIRQKFQFVVNDGEGQQAYKVSPVLSANVTTAPVIYQADIEAAVLASQTNSYDSYWKLLGDVQSKLVKEFYVDYTTSDGNSILVEVFADGNTVPYYTIVLPSNAARAEVPTRKRLPAIKLRQFRMVMTSMVSSGSFQIWSPIALAHKPVIGGKGYMNTDLGSLTP